MIFKIRNASLSQALINHMRWVGNTFPDATPVQHWEKTREELNHLGANPTTPDDYADVILCTMSMAASAGLSASQVIEAIKAKVDKNRVRKWEATPDDPNGTFRHTDED